jgi:hypothetical protein
MIASIAKIPRPAPATTLPPADPSGASAASSLLAGASASAGPSAPGESAIGASATGPSATGPGPSAGASAVVSASSDGAEAGASSPSSDGGAAFLPFAGAGAEARGAGAAALPPTPGGTMAALTWITETLYGREATGLTIRDAYCAPGSADPNTMSPSSRFVRLRKPMRSVAWPEDWKSVVSVADLPLMASSLAAS